ncbi:FtsX-like permease family protein [Knoellia remsis]|uniref:FtsX-like permease family protein n=1 Tax=Knoellia remsis TaxID=407159 RepID=A0A2T0UTV1_9MICO|nr:ABC transporter permease [Knoellia remsis]PRY61288.1 FtsX-like permease family protein [Knoellia remsis]
MIGFRDSITLAHTKIRSKRIRMLITTIVSGLLFGIIGGGVLLFDGTSASVDRFADENLGGRYLVQGTPTIPADQAFPNPEDPALLKTITAEHAAYLEERKAAAKKYDIDDYDPKDEVPAVVDNPYGDPSIPAGQRKMVNQESVVWKRHLAEVYEKASANAKATPEAFATAARADGATETYQPKPLRSLALTFLKDGREDLTKVVTPEEQQAQMENGPPSSIESSELTLLDDELVSAFVTDPSTRGTPKGIPVLVPVDDVVATLGAQLGLSKRPKDSAAQIDWFREVKEKSNGVTFTECYRNAAENTRVEEARQQAAEIAANAKKPGWTKPSRILALPTTPCGEVTVASDTRSAREKKADANREAFEAQFEPKEAPRAELLTFQVVGVLPSDQSSMSGLEAVIGGIVGTRFGYGSIVPAGLLEAVPAALRGGDLLTKPPVTTTPDQMMFGPYGPDAAFIASFPTVEQAKTFLRSQACPGMDSFAGDVYYECGKAFSVGTYGSNYLVVDDIARQGRPFLIGILAVLFGIATIIIWAMMGRVIADSRRETAVFRAIGAKRSDIIGVYLLYSLWVALRIALFAALLAAAIAVAIEYLYAERATRAAQLAYGVFDGDARFHFLGVPGPVFWAILGGIMLMALVAITPPLLRNIRRNPIRDMRDE